ncbi:class I SAM-dependent methyltransferase [Demequina zhanjiangensis]|uniref:Class I SAM-dependent methyltransferase n=1 Tax=Demequina zhanjiangensis TaxID=3051659 RepID=A0ABT8FXC9_9MICO|nr:class I SAM-dependent methyltransferase [Demequina sp. SYSU T00b26]MDN4471555.1 class I SAM-dependent methyltransferase [Demequina sp. SYSU T00b26]
MEAETARMLLEPETLALIDSMPPYEEIEPLSFGSRLRAQGLDGGLVAAVLTQAELRHKARAKLGEFADGMLFTREGLEQATRLSVAARHARRYAAAGCERVADLTAGLGVDAMTMSALGLPVVAFERDEATALLADHHLRHWRDSVVVHADSMSTVRDVPGVDAIFADPARRTGRGRRHDPRDYSPPLDEVLALRDQFPALGVKVGPGIPHDALPSASHGPVEAQWVSVDGDVVEAGLWCGPLAQREGHAALVIHGDEAHEIAGDPVHGEMGGLGEYLYEPDGAVIRAGLVGPLGDSIGAHLVDPTIAYLTSDSQVSTPFARGYRVLESMPYSTSRLAKALRAREVGRVEIKKRGIDVTPERLRPQLKLRGTEAATVVLTRVAGRHTALLVEPLPR